MYLNVPSLMKNYFNLGFSWSPKETCVFTNSILKDKMSSLGFLKFLILPIFLENVALTSENRKRRFLFFIFPKKLSFKYTIFYFFWTILLSNFPYKNCQDLYEKVARYLTFSFWKTIFQLILVILQIVSLLSTIHLKNTRAQ